MPHNLRYGGVVGVAALLLAGAAACGPRYALGGGAGLVNVSTGGSDEQTLSLVAAARVGVPRRGGVLAMVDVQALPAGNPSRDESVSTAFLLPAVQVPAGPLALRAGAGPSLHLWTGSDPAETWSVGLAWGGSVEVRPRGEGRWAVEGFVRGATGDEFSLQVFGVQALRYVR